MDQGKLVFSQLMAFLPLSTFRRCVAMHRGDHKVQDFTCMDQFLTMAFAQLTYRESLRDIEVNLRAQAKRLYHMGLRCKTVSRNTLANANATRPWQIYADLAQHLIGMARPLYANEPLGIELDATVYAFDATTIDLCLSLYPWAPFRRAKAAVKLHTLLDLRGSHPVDRINTNVLCDQTGVLTVFYSSKDYPTVLRRVVVRDETGKRITFLTNNFALKPELIAALYR